VLHPEVNGVSSFVQKLFVANSAIPLFNVGMYNLKQGKSEQIFN